MVKKPEGIACTEILTTEGRLSICLNDPEILKAIISLPKNLLPHEPLVLYGKIVIAKETSKGTLHIFFSHGTPNEYSPIRLDFAQGTSITLNIISGKSKHNP